MPPPPPPLPELVGAVSVTMRNATTTMTAMPRATAAPTNARKRQRESLGALKAVAVRTRPPARGFLREAAGFGAAVLLSGDSPDTAAARAREAARAALSTGAPADRPAMAGVCVLERGMPRSEALICARASAPATAMPSSVVGGAMRPLPPPRVLLRKDTARASAMARELAAARAAASGDSPAAATTPTPRVLGVPRTTAGRELERSRAGDSTPLEKNTRVLAPAGKKRPLAPGKRTLPLPPTRTKREPSCPFSACPSS